MSKGYSETRMLMRLKSIENKIMRMDEIRDLSSLETINITLLLGLIGVSVALLTHFLSINIGYIGVSLLAVLILSGFIVAHIIAIYRNNLFSRLHAFVTEGTITIIIVFSQLFSYVWQRILSDLMSPIFMYIVLFVLCFLFARFFESPIEKRIEVKIVHRFPILAKESKFDLLLKRH